MSTTSISTLVTIAPRGMSFHGYSLRHDFLGSPCRPKQDACNCAECTLPGQDDQSARLAASAEVDHLEGTITDEQLCAWHDAQSEEFLVDMYERFGADTPRQVWAAFKEGKRTLRCGHCDSARLEEFCHEPPFVRFSCKHCGCGMDKDLNVISQPRLIDVGISELPENAIVTGFAEQDDGFKYPFGYVRAEGFFMCDRDGWAMWSSVEGFALAIGNRMQGQGA